MITSTAATTDAEAWTKAFDFLSDCNPEFGKKYYKKWTASRRAARRMGWRIIKVRGVVVD